MSKRRSALCGLVGFLLAASVALAASARDQVSNVRAAHRDGQTIVTWDEVRSPLATGSITMGALREALRTRDAKEKIRYRIYRSEAPLESAAGAELVAEVPQLAGWNADYYGSDPKPEAPAFRYVVEDGAAPVPPGTAIYVHNPKRAGLAHYAVTVSVDGVENTKIGPVNRLGEPVRETVGPGVPVLQRVVKPASFQYVEGPTLHYFVRWEAPPNSNVESRPFDYVVAVPPAPAKPAPVGIHLHCWGGSLDGGYGWWYNAEKGALLIASNQIPYDWWTGYHELNGTGPREEKTWRGGVVRPYTQRRLFAFLDWVATKWDVDLTRTFVAGSSMGGSGAPMLAIRYPDRIAWAISWVGVHTPARSPQFKGSYAQVFGEPDWKVKFEDGTPVWDYYNDVFYLKEHPKAEIGLITFSNGKNDGAIGWPQAAAFFRALQETRRPHVFVWGQSGHGQRAHMPVTLEERVLPIDVRTGQSLPAFTRSSLDQNAGNGDPADGDPEGQANLYLSWETGDIVDTTESWEMTVAVIEKAPRDSCTVDVTPRRLQRFTVDPGASISWTNTSLREAQVIQSGTAQADRVGLVTLPKLTVTKGKNRLRMAR